MKTSTIVFLLSLVCLLLLTVYMHFNNFNPDIIISTVAIGLLVILLSGLSFVIYTIVISTRETIAFRKNIKIGDKVKNFNGAEGTVTKIDGDNITISVESYISLVYPIEE